MPKPSVKLISAFHREDLCQQIWCHVQWFVSVEGFRQAALDAIHSVQWLPASGQRRITSMVEGRSDWCISRQRSWGVPLPVLYYIDTGATSCMEPSLYSHRL